MGRKFGLKTFEDKLGKQIGWSEVRILKFVGWDLNEVTTSFVLADFGTQNAIRSLDARSVDWILQNNKLAGADSEFPANPTVPGCSKQENSTRKSTRRSDAAVSVICCESDLRFSLLISTQ